MLNFKINDKMFFESKSYQHEMFNNLWRNNFISSKTITLYGDLLNNAKDYFSLKTMITLKKYVYDFKKSHTFYEYIFLFVEG